jgi:hypothetical protein
MDVDKGGFVTIKANDGSNLTYFLRQAAATDVTPIVINVEENFVDSGANHLRSSFKKNQH